jgi:phage terminase large subunit
MTLEIKHTVVFTKNFEQLNNPDIRFIFNQGGSRCHAPGTLIRMYDGTLKKVEDIVIGDKVASYDGLSYNTVTDTHSGVDDMYLIQQGKGDDYIVNRNHLLVVNSPNNEMKYISAEDYSKLKDNINKYTGIRIIDGKVINTKIKSTYIGKGDYYGFTLDKNPLYKLKDGTITHNSSKTVSLSQLMIIYCLQNPNKVVSIVRKTFPTLRSSVMRDFFTLMKNYGIYKESSHNKTEHTYVFENGSMVEFFSCDNEQKLRGRKRDLLWINEANELLYEDFYQLNIRTSEKIFFDFNPSFYNHWIYEVMERDNSTMIHSTYKDNPFLEASQVKEIEDTKYSDEDYYTIFALGQRAFSKENVFKKWDVVDEKPENLNEKIYAIDFGYTHPTAVVEINYNPKLKDIYVRELLYESYLTSQDIINRLNDLNLDKTWVMVADYARPEIIQDMKRNGFNMVNAIKDVKDGIMAVKYFNVMISPDSKNLENENLSYKYKKVNGILTEEPSKINDDLMDSLRYGLMYIKKYRLDVPQNEGVTSIFSFNI